MSLKTRVQVPVIDDQSPFVGSWFRNQEPSRDPGTVGSVYPYIIKESLIFLFISSSLVPTARMGLHARG